METDSFFYNLFKQIPTALFDLLGMPESRARKYRFDSVELKKALRIDGMFVPKSNDLPLYFLEVQYQRTKTFYANLFAKVFCYLDENDPAQDWNAVALFENRRAEPSNLGPYWLLLESRHVQRIYLDEYPMPANPPYGIGILQLLNAPETEAKRLVSNLVGRVEHDSELARSGKAASVIELIEELLVRRFSHLGREEIRRMFQLQDIRKTKVYQEGREDGREEGRVEGRVEGREEGETHAHRVMIHNCLLKGMTHQAIAELVGLPLKEVRRLAKDASK